ncbi:MAG: hypothetical protein GY861_23340 [bacterium]|nr:hypothetical protein [bacterium]
MNTIQGLLLTLLVLIGLVIFWYQMQALSNVKDGTRTNFNVGLFFKSAHFNEEGNRYRKIYLLMFIPWLIIGVVLLVLVSNQ